MRISFLLLFVILTLSVAPAAQAAQPLIDHRPTYYRGEIPQLVVRKLPPSQTARVHILRTLEIWRDDGTGQYRPQDTVMHGWAEYRADSKGMIDLVTAKPLTGTTQKVGATTLFWSAYPKGSAQLASVAAVSDTIRKAPGNTIFAIVEKDGAVLAQSEFQIGQQRSAMTVVEVNMPGLVGVFAAPKHASKLPTLIHMHGSEGGSLGKATADAEQYAENGFATFALAYFTWDYDRTAEKLPAEHINVELEILQRARDWLAQRPESDVSRLGLIGNSKGGEFAMLGATYFPWVKAAVGCVPSDVVWEGYGRFAKPGEVISSWSFGGTPLPYIPTYNSKREGWPNNGARYAQARAEFKAEALAARIPIERSKAKLFVIGGDRDETWASGEMSDALVATMRKAGKGRQIQSYISPTAGHSLCGDGLWPHRAYQRDSDSPGAPVIDDEGAAADIAYRRKIQFLQKALR